MKAINMKNMPTIDRLKKLNEAKTPDYMPIFTAVKWVDNGTERTEQNFRNELGKLLLDNKYKLEEIELDDSSWEDDVVTMNLYGTEKLTNDLEKNDYLEFKNDILELTAEM